MDTFLQKYVDRVSDVPAQLKRLFKLIRDLDERVAKLLGEVDEACKQQLIAAAEAAAAPPPAKRQKGAQQAPPAHDGSTAFSPELEASMQKVLSLSEEKMKIAQQLYDLVDGHIRELDADLASVKGRMQGDRAALKLKDNQTACELLGKERPAVTMQPEVRQKRKYVRRKGVYPPPPPPEKKSKSSSIEAARAAAAAAATAKAPMAQAGEKTLPAGVPLLLPDSSEPRYCICNNVSYGEMIACDNPECTIEWFHYGCVGIKQQPKGKWYCPQCTKIMKKGKGKA